MGCTAPAAVFGRRVVTDPNQPDDTLGCAPRKPSLLQAQLGSHVARETHGRKHRRFVSSQPNAAVQNTMGAIPSQ